MTTVSWLIRDIGGCQAVSCDKSVRFPVYSDAAITGCKRNADIARDMRTNQLKNKNVLVIEDEPDIAELLALHLRDICADVVLAADGHEGMRQAFTRSWDLIILDLRLPGPDGLTICRALRQNESYVPIIMLTSKSSELDRVLGLELGADDYVTKPFSVSELMARVRAIFRRIDSLGQTETDAVTKLTVGSLTIDPARRQVTVDGQTVDLTAREFDLLLHFARHPGHVFRRTQLLDSVWGYGHDGYEHTVNSHINRLRSKIEADPSQPAYIVTVWGVGYKLDTSNAHQVPR